MRERFILVNILTIYNYHRIYIYVLFKVKYT